MAPVLASRICIAIALCSLASRPSIILDRWPCQEWSWREKPVESGQIELFTHKVFKVKQEGHLKPKGRWWVSGLQGG